MRSHRIFSLAIMLWARIIGFMSNARTMNTNTAGEGRHPRRLFRRFAAQGEAMAYRETHSNDSTNVHTAQDLAGFDAARRLELAVEIAEHLRKFRLDNVAGTVSVLAIRDALANHLEAIELAADLEGTEIVHTVITGGGYLRNDRVAIVTAVDDSLDARRSLSTITTRRVRIAGDEITSEPTVATTEIVGPGGEVLVRTHELAAIGGAR